MMIAVLTPNRRGRPRAEEPRSSVTCVVTARQHDALIREAHARRVSVSALIRERAGFSLPQKSKTGR